MPTSPRPGHRAAAAGIGDSRPHAVTGNKRLLILAGVFVTGLVLIAAMSLTFSSLIDDLDRQGDNERARLFIGEEIVRGIRQIEMGFYQMATTRGSRAREMIEATTLRHIEKLQTDLKALQHGGTVRQTVLLNIDGVDEMVREARYQPPPGGSSYVMEIIEISPQLDPIRQHSATLRGMLDEVEDLQDGTDHGAERSRERDVAIYLKGMRPFFHRLNENANRLFYDSSREITRIEADLANKRQQYKSLEFILMVLVIAVVSLFGFMVVRQMKESNEKLRAAWEAMRGARDQAEEANRAKSDFVSRMSHELRTPLNAILGFAHLLEDEPITPTQRQYVATINQAGKHLLDLINRILDMAKIEAGKLELERIEFDPLRLADEVALIIGKNALAKGLEFQAITDPNLPSRILGDPTRLRQVLINLLGNAIKFTESGQVGLRVVATDSGRRMGIEIRDSGIGMTPETLAKLFTPFAQADESSSRKYEGTGLGLAISKDLVEAMGGRIEVESALGHGSRFRIDLPVEASADAPSRSRLLRDQAVLLVSADAGLRIAIGEVLQQLGARVMEASGVEQGNVLLGGEGPTPAWILADQETPGLMQMCGTLAGQPGVRRLLIAARGTQPLLSEHREHADAILQRPVTYSQISDAVAAILSRPETPPPQATASADGAGPLAGHVLLVEDNLINQKLASLLLKKLGITHDLANNGVEAVDLAGKRPYDLILMDMEMPEMDGLAATRAIREQEAQAGAGHVAIIAMTANAMLEDRDRCLEAGMDDHLAKPVEFEKLREQLSRWLGRGR